MRSTLFGAVAGGILAASTRSAIASVAAFGSNPGALRMLVYAPSRLRAARPLVVVLHGCSQDAADFANDAGWISLARQYRFALLLPEQNHKNNRARCFNWFRPEDGRRGCGEALSIRQMIRGAVKRFGSDPRQVFVVGFSAGAAMAAALLVAYPALFAAGGVVAGMPVGCASTAARAMLRMRRADLFRTRIALADDVRAATGLPARKSWPRVSIWQGERDRIVDPGNAEALAAQWSELHGYGPEPGSDQTVSGVRIRSWGRPNRPVSVDLWTVAGLGHGFPVDPRHPLGGRAGAWVADAGLSAAQLLVTFWGIGLPKP